MASWTTYKGLDVPDATTGDAGTNLKDNFKDLADRAPFLSSSNPTVNDDSTKGFVAGSQWLNSSTQTLWMCTSATATAAKWRSLYKRIDNAIVLAPEGGIGSGSDGRAIQLDDSADARGANAVDLQRSRSANNQVASGSKSAILSGENNRAYSANSAVVGGKGNSAGAGSGTISNIATGNPSTVTSTSHGLVTGMRIAISGSNSTPSIDGTRIIIVPNANTFLVPVNVTATGNAGTWDTSATAAYAIVAGGQNNKAFGLRSHAEGHNSIAAGITAHAEGTFGYASGSMSHAEGGYAMATGWGAHAEGLYSVASGVSAHAESGNTTASGAYSHAEGIQCVGSGYATHAEGGTTVASGINAHSEGNSTTASGYFAHAEGASTVAAANCSHAGGSGSKAYLSAQWARSSGGHSSQVGTAQSTVTQLLRLSTSASATELTLGGGTPAASTRFTIQDGQTLSCLINIVGRKENGGANDHASFLRQVCIRREGSTTQLVDTVKTVGTDINPASWGGVSITADDTNESLKIEVTGVASTNIRWTATVIASEAADAAI